MTTEWRSKNRDRRSDSLRSRNQLADIHSNRSKKFRRRKAAELFDGVSSMPTAFELLALDLPTLDKSDIYPSLAQVEPRSSLDASVIAFFIESLIDIAVEERYSLALGDIFEATLRNRALSPIYPELDISRIPKEKLSPQDMQALARFEAIRRQQSPPPPEPANEPGRSTNRKGPDVKSRHKQ
jgi:hypothetical protein